MNRHYIIEHLIHENYILTQKYNEILHQFNELQKEIETLKKINRQPQNETTILKILQNTNTELNRELIKKNKQIAMFLNNNEGSLLLENVLTADKIV